MVYYESNNQNGDYLAHHGIKGQRWGVRRYQNPDGTLTEAGKSRLEKLRAKYSEKNEALKKYEKTYSQTDSAQTKLNRDQAMWEAQRVKNKIDKLLNNGEELPISKLSPKAVSYGKKALNGARIAASFAMPIAGLVVGAGGINAIASVINGISVAANTSAVANAASVSPYYEYDLHRAMNDLERYNSRR